MAAAAESVGRVHALGRAVRHVAADAVRRSPEHQLVVEVHPSDLLDDRLVDAASPLARRARSVILKLVGRAPLHSIAHAKGRLDALKALGFQVALEDLGGTCDGLNMLAELAPDVVDLDGDIVRGVHRERSKRAIVRCVAALCRDLGARVMASGVETDEDAAALVDAGCDLMRGPLFGAPVAPLEG